MNSIVIVDTSCLISLSNVNSLQLLKDTYSRVYITDEINKEFNEKLPLFIEILKPNQKKIDELSEILDIGEASAIALALENPNSLLIIDDAKGRKFAAKYGLKIVGTIGFLIKAQKSGVIKDAFPIIIHMINNGFRISKTVLNKLIEFYNK